MLVRITKRDDGTLDVAMSGGAGGGMGSTSSHACVRVGERWRGWKYSRLVKLAGCGDVELQTNDQRRAAEGVEIQGDR